MALVLNVYKTEYCLDAYSTDGAMTDPIFAYPPIDFDGVAGQSRDIQLWLKNDGDLIGRNVRITPYDDTGSDESTWMKLATTQGGLASAIAGQYLDVGEDLDPAEVWTFWLRTTVPAGTDSADKQDLSLRITGNGYAS